MPPRRNRVDDVHVAELRAALFARTRKTVLVFYVGLAAGAIAAGAFALTSSLRGGLEGLAGGFAVALLLFAISPLFKVSARTARSLTTLTAGAGVLLASLSGDIQSALGLSTATVVGAAAGFFGGTILGIAAIRRRLGWDDELLLRQKRLGFDPEQPYGWLRQRGQS